MPTIHTRRLGEYSRTQLVAVCWRSHPFVPIVACPVRLRRRATLIRFSPSVQVADAIRRNVLLGSSGIGIAAAYGLACGARKLEDIGFEEEWNRMCANMAATRPTAPDLFRCIEAMKREVSEHRGTHPALLERLTLRADELQSARMALDTALSDQGDEFIKSGVRPHALLPRRVAWCIHVHSASL
jgi:methylthioribose-1-phosphate isomerase